MERVVNGFRKQFSFSNLPLANWFPGHMAKGTIHCNEFTFLISHSKSLMLACMLWYDGTMIRIKRHCKTIAILRLCHWSSWCKSIHTNLIHSFKITFRCISITPFPISHSLVAIPISNSCSEEDPSCSSWIKWIWQIQQNHRLPGYYSAYFSPYKSCFINTSGYNTVLAWTGWEGDTFHQPT